MTNKIELIEFYSKSGSYTETGKFFNISRQRVHQILTGYKTVATKKGKGKWGFPKLLKALYGKPCSRCGAKTEHIHHLDGNSKNNTELNLIPVCKSCHTSYHKERNIFEARTIDCRGGCGKYLFIKRKTAKGYCNTCRLAKRDGRIRIFREKSNECVGCAKSFKEIKHHALNRCENCYSKHRFSLPKVKEWRSAYNKRKWASYKEEKDNG